jgi:quercetin dioxygenase-like cupin family protein
MRMQEMPFSTVDWSAIEPTKHAGERGTALWRTQNFGPRDNPVRVRMVEYTPGYISDHWCSKGHVLLCLSGELETTLADGRVFVLKPGMSYQVADNAEAHQSRTEIGATLFIVD